MADEIIDIVVKNLTYFSYASVTLAFISGCCRLREVRIFERILFTALLVAFIAFYSPILDGGIELFEELTSTGDSRIDVYLERCRTVRFEGDSGFFDDFITSLQANFFKMLLSCSCILRAISGFLQSFFVVAFKVMAPLVLGLAAWDNFRNILYNFITCSLAVMMWSVGYQIADIFILKGIGLIGIPTALDSATGVIAVSGGSALLGLLVFLCALIIGMCIFYLLTPLVIFSVLSGANPGTAVTGNMRTAALASIAGTRPVVMMVKQISSGTLNNRYSTVKTASPAISLDSVTRAMGKNK
ncbi:MAG: hypothetical protein PHV59_01610 [Victivallales bacterium]|nr:hypothetical protein [Victivallales bacterium]